MTYATQTRTTTGALGARLGGLRSALAGRYAKYKVYRNTMNELSALTDRDLADLGINRSMISSIATEAAETAR